MAVGMAQVASLHSRNGAWNMHSRTHGPLNSWSMDDGVHGPWTMNSMLHGLGLRTPWSMDSMVPGIHGPWNTWFGAMESMVPNRALGGLGLISLRSYTCRGTCLYVKNLVPRIGFLEPPRGFNNLGVPKRYKNQCFTTPGLPNRAKTMVSET